MTALQSVYPGDTVFTANDGLGTVESVRGNPPSEAVIRFDSGSSKRVVLPNASLIKPSQQGFLVLAAREPARVRELLHEKPDDVIVMLLQDAPGHSMETADIRENLVPKWVKEDEWTQWWAAVRTKLKKRPDIDTSQAKRQRYALATAASSRELELKTLLEERSLSAADRLSYLREILVLTDKAARNDEARDQIRNQLDQLSRLQTTEPWVRIMALILLGEQRWITEDELQRRLQALIDVPVRWRPVVKIDQFQTAQALLLDISQGSGVVPAAVWSGLLARPLSADWLLRELLHQRNGAEVTIALCEAISAVYPPELEPIEAAPDWSIDFVNTVEKVRCDWEHGAAARQIDWSQVCEAMLTAVCAATPQNLTKKGYVAAGLSIVSSAINWYPTRDLYHRASWLADWIRNATRAPHLQGMVIEALLAHNNPALMDAFLEQMAGQSDPAFADLCRIAVEKSQGSRQSQTTVSTLARITRACQGSLRNYPETAGVVLRYASDLASAAKPDELVRLLYIVQTALSAFSEPSEANVAIEHRLWRRTLDTALNGTLKSTRDGVVLSEVFADELASVVEEYQDALAKELKATQALVHEITKQLDAARQSLAEAEKRRQEALRSIAQSQASSNAVSDDRRLLAEVAQILAETDRVATTQQLRPEAVAQLLQARLGRLLKRARVRQVGHIGERIPFDPRRHEIIEGTLGPRQIVEVVEVGHEQLLENGEASGVKTALVRATGE